MRRQMGNFLPVVMIAIWVQLFAPIGAYWTMAAASDPLASSLICSSAMTAQADQTAPAQQKPLHLDCWSLCTVAHGGAAPLTSPDPVIAQIVRSPQQIVWLDGIVELPSGHRGFHAQARAPPAIS